MRKGEQADAVIEIEPAADDETDANLFCGLMRAHDPGNAVMVGNRDRPVPERRRSQYQLGRVRGAAQKREIGRDLQLGISRGFSDRLSMSSARSTEFRHSREAGGQG